MLHICATCRFGKGIGKTYAPCPSGPDDGVNCTNPKMAECLDGKQGERYSQEAFAAAGYINLFRIEVISDGTAACPMWKEKHSFRIPFPKDGTLMVHTPLAGLLINVSWLWWGRKTGHPVWAIKWKSKV